MTTAQESRDRPGPPGQLAPTPSQTVGPFFGYALPFDGGAHLVPPGSPGSVRLTGTLYDADGQPVPDALIELWQADGAGEVPQVPGSRDRDGWTFTGFGRAAVDPDGRYTFTTIEPGAVGSGAAGSGPAGAAAAPFFTLTVFARGLLRHLFTRAYLPGTDPGSVPLLRSLPDDRSATLVCGRDEHGYVFDIHLGGPDETVFLDFGPDPHGTDTDPRGPAAHEAG